MHGQNDLPNGKEVMPNDGTPLSDIWYTFEEVMAIFNRGKSTINRWRRLKEDWLVCFKVGGVVLVNKTDLDNFRKIHRK